MRHRRGLSVAAQEHTFSSEPYLRIERSFSWQREKFVVRKDQTTYARSIQKGQPTAWNGRQHRQQLVSQKLMLLCPLSFLFLPDVLRGRVAWTTAVAFSVFIGQTHIGHRNRMHRCKQM
jgi:hypothetical protein